MPKDKKDFRDILKTEGVKTKGFGIIPKLVMLDRKLTIEAKAIYAYFCSYAGSGNTAFPSRDKICADLTISKDRYYRHFKLLKEYGYIKVEQIVNDKNKFSHNIYSLIENPTIAPCPQNKDAGNKKPCPENKDTQNKDTEFEDTENKDIKRNKSLFKNNKSLPKRNKSLYNQSVSNIDQTNKLTEEQNKFEQQQLNNIISKVLDPFKDRDIKKLIEPVLEVMYFSDYLNVCGAKIPQVIIRKNMERLDAAIIDYALSKFRNNNENTNKIKNSTKYLASIIYNCILEYDSDVLADPDLNNFTLDETNDSTVENSQNEQKESVTKYIEDDINNSVKVEEVKTAKTLPLLERFKNTEFEKPIIELKNQLSPASYITWFDTIDDLRMDSNILTIKLRNHSAVEAIEKSYFKLAKQVFGEIGIEKIQLETVVN